MILCIQTPVRHPTVTFSKSLDDKPDPVVVWESKETKTGDKLMKQMENLLKLPKTDETSTLYDIGLNLDFER